MLKKEVLELLKEIEDDAEIDSLLQSTDLFKSAEFKVIFKFSGKFHSS